MLLSTPEAPEDVEFDSPPASPEVSGDVEVAEVVPEVTVVITKAPETPAPLEAGSFRFKWVF